MVKDEVFEREKDDLDEKVDVRTEEAMAAARAAVAAHTMGLQFGEAVLVENRYGGYDVADCIKEIFPARFGDGQCTSVFVSFNDVLSGLDEEVNAALASEETLNATPVELLTRYAFMLQAREIDMWLLKTDVDKIARRVVAASLPLPPPSTPREVNWGSKYQEILWMNRLYNDVLVLVNDMKAQIEIITASLLENGSMSSEEVQRLLGRECGQRLAA